MNGGGGGGVTIQAWEFRHPHFRRNRPDLLPMIKRKSNKHPPPTPLSTHNPNTTNNQNNNIPPLQLPPPPPPSLGPLHGHPPPPPPLFIKPTSHPSSSSSVSTPPLHSLNTFLDSNLIHRSNASESLSPDHLLNLNSSLTLIRPYDPVRDPNGVTVASKTTSPTTTTTTIPHHSLSGINPKSLNHEDRREISEILRMMLGLIASSNHSSSSSSTPSLLHHHRTSFLFSYLSYLVSPPFSFHIYIYNMCQKEIEKKNLIPNVFIFGKYFIFDL